MSEPTPHGPDLQARLDKLGKLVRLSLALNALMLVVSGGLVYVVFAIVLAEPTDVAGVTDFEAPQSGDGDVDYRIEMRDFMERMSSLLDRQARKAGVNPADVIPTQTEIDDAVETRTMHSDASQKVLQKLREGFDYFDMTWPIAIPER